MGSVRSRSTAASPCLPARAAAEECRYVYFYAFLPNLLLSLHPDYVMTHTLRPRGVDRTEIVCEWLFHPDAMAELRASTRKTRSHSGISPTARTGTSANRCSSASTSRAYRPGPYSHREDLLHGFDRLILELERNASRSPR